MSIEFIWQLPARGDARYGDATRRLRGERRLGEPSPLLEGVTDPRGDAFNYFDHLHQIARAAELSTFDGFRVRHDPEGDESWIISGYVARASRRSRIITELEASWGSAVYAAKNAVTFQRYTGGRQAWYVTTGAGEAERKRLADGVPDVDVLARIDELLTVARGVITRAPFSFAGRFFQVRDGGFQGALGGHAVPRIYLDGESEAAYALSARHADVHVLPPLPPEALALRVATLGTLAEATEREGRPLACGVRVDVLARETRDEAHEDAHRLAAQSGERAWNDPTSAVLWSGTRPSPAAAATLVGDYDEVAEHLAAYASVGVTSFLLGAEPHLEEAYRVGTHVLPRVRERISESRRAA